MVGCEGLVWHVPINLSCEFKRAEDWRQGNAPDIRPLTRPQTSCKHAEVQAAGR